MYRKTVQCYVFVLTLLDISLNNRLTAQGKSHDVSMHDSLIEGITFQEWGKESSGSVGGGGGGGGGPEALRLSPPALSFGRAQLAAAHRLTVTLTNAANTTVHLASVAGTTPDFHASFFESKTLPPAGNTTFSVVYLGRREGPVWAHLYIHTSLGVHKYPVSAEGVASEWGVWPLVGLRVPLDASLEPLLELYNPTDQPVQVSEVYSSGGWVTLSLPDSGGTEGEGKEGEDTDGEGKEAAVGGAAWRVPPRESRPLVKLRLRPPHPPADRPRPAYIRIKGSLVGGAAGGLVVAVEAEAAGAGAYLAPPQLRLRARGSNDPPGTWEVSAGNSGPTAVELEGAVWGARCSRTPPPPLPPPHPAAPSAHHSPARANGARVEGATVRVVRATLPPHQPPVEALHLTLNYDRLWASYERSSSEESGTDGADGSDSTDGAWCSGWVVAGGASMPYSVRLLRGTLTLLPPHLDIITGGQGSGQTSGLTPREIRARNDFPTPLHLHRMHCGPQLAEHFECTSSLPLVLESGREAVVGTVTPRAAPAPPPPLRAVIAVHTNLTTYSLPVTVHSGTLDLEWEWPMSSDGTLRLGTVGAMSTRRVGLRVHNRGPRALCAASIRARLPHAAAALALARCDSPDPPPDHPCRCVPGGGWAQAWLTVVAPAAEGVLEGGVWLSTGHAASRASITLRVRAGLVWTRALELSPAAPYVHSWAPLVVENTMAVGMRLLEPPATTHHDPNLEFLVDGEGWVGPGRGAAGRLLYAAERGCRPHCYTGLNLSDTEGISWLERGSVNDAVSLQRDVEVMRARMARVPPAVNLTLRMHTTEVVNIPVSGSVQLHWPSLAEGGSGGEGGGGAVAGVGETVLVTVRVKNPAVTPLLIQPTLHQPLTMSEVPPSFCSPGPCVWDADAFSLAESPTGPAGDGAPVGDGAPLFPTHAPPNRPVYLLPAGASMDVKIKFMPTIAAPLATYLYLRNNLTIVEIIPVWGHGAHPSFELGGRRGDAGGAPLALEVTECAGPGGAGGARRQLALRNTGPVPLRLSDWRVAGTPCAARGFRLHPCAPLALQPNETRALRLSFHPDYTLARAAASLTVRADAARAEFRLRAAAPARIVRLCAASLPRPPFEPPLRAAGAALALAALALIVAAAAVDAERALRRARHARPPPVPTARAPLDLRAAARAPPPVAPAPPARRRPKPRRPPPPDPRAPLAERRAFERWRAEVLRRAEREDDHSSEDGVPPQEEPSPPEQDSPPRSTPSPVDDDQDADATRPSSDEAGRSGDSSVGSDSSPGDDLECLETRDDSEPDAGPPPPAEPPASTPDPPDNDQHTPPKKPDVRREVRPRRENGDASRRCERRSGGGEAGEGREARALRGGGARAHVRRDKALRRRGVERDKGTPPRSPPQAAAAAPHPPPALRWGASWSSVVAAGNAASPNNNTGAGAPLPPIGSDVRRRAEERADQSLFYFNGEQAGALERGADAFAWRPPPERALYPPPPPRRAYLPDYEEPSTLNGYGSVWAGGAWAWGGGLGVRPPPGFGAPAAPPAPRAYDPFRSLAAIWAPGGGALDWRADPDPAPNAPTAPPAPHDEARPDE